MRSKKTGISLVALVVTIIVLIILTGAVIMTFMEGGIIDRANEAVFKNDIREYQSKLIVLKADEQIKISTGKQAESNLNGDSTDVIQGFLPEFKEKYNDILKVVDGELVLKVAIDDIEDDNYRTWLTDLGFGTEAEEGDTGEDIIVTELTIAENYKFLATSGDNSTMTLSATTVPSGAKVTWTSNNPSIATVNANTGLVTGIAEGNATITATSGGQTATYTVTVGEEVSVFLDSVTFGRLTVTGIAGMTWEELSTDDRYTEINPEFGETGDGEVDILNDDWDQILWTSDDIDGDGITDDVHAQWTERFDLMTSWCDS